MSHPLIYVLGDTEIKGFPLILTIGREPNYDDVLTDTIGIMDAKKFASMSGGVWVTAYTQFAKQYIGEKGNAVFLKELCFNKNSSPIIFSNAFPLGIPQEVSDKDSIRKKLAGLIPDHVNKIFSKDIIRMVKLVVHHGSDQSEVSKLARRHIEEKCYELGIPYCATDFFYNGNSRNIQNSLMDFEENIRLVFNEFLCN